MKIIAKMGLAAGLALAAAGLTASSASAMPMNGLDPAVATTSDLAANNTESVAYVCGPWGCRWRPNYWGPRPYGYGYRRFGGYGYRGGYRRGWGGYHRHW